jgi:hypothetical protein
MVYRKFAKMHGWPPEVVRRLTLNEMYWLPVIDDAESAAVEKYQALLDKQNSNN